MSRLRASCSDSWTLFAMGFCRGTEALAYLSVIPADAAIHGAFRPGTKWVPAFARMTRASAQHANLQLRVVAGCRERRDRLIARLGERVLDRAAAARLAFELAVDEPQHLAARTQRAQAHDRGFF